MRLLKQTFGTELTFQSKIKMMKQILTIFFLLISFSLAGQLSPVTSQYVLNPLSINPAYAGNRGALNIAAFYRRQWVGIDGSPQTMSIAADAPLLDSKLGVGFSIVNDKLGVTKETQFHTTYSYKIKMGKGKLSLGLGAGIITTNTAWSDLVVLDPGDEYFLINSRVFVVPDFSFGVYYSYQNYFAGLSIPKLLGYKFDFNKNKYSLTFAPDQNYYLFNTGYVFSLSQSVKFFPSTLITYSSGERILFDLNAHLNYRDRFWFGVSYRNGRSISSLIQVAVNNQFRVAYTYDFDFGKLGRYSNGSHEIMLRYEFKYKVELANPLGL
jgi:type IX secretion system PorP/SprF family membrane protein